MLVTKDGAAAGDQNQYSTTGTPGTAVFPTGYLYETGYDDPNVLNFRQGALPYSLLLGC